jgi:hypothetical protein
VYLVLHASSPLLLYNTAAAAAEGDHRTSRRSHQRVMVLRSARVAQQSNTDTPDGVAISHTEILALTGCRRQWLHSSHTTGASP